VDTGRMYTDFDMEGLLELIQNTGADDKE